MTLIGTTVSNVRRHRVTDLAAALTYYSVLAIFPAALALLSLLALVGEADSSLQTILDVLRPLVSRQTLDDLEPTLRDLTRFSGASWTFAIGVVGALWSASAYVGAFARANNTIREVEETRPFWKLRPLVLLITVVLVVLNAAALLIIVATGKVAESLGDQIGLGSSFLDVWQVAKWPGLAILVIVAVALLIHATPDYRTGIRLLSPGAFVAILVWAAASAGFALYVASFSSYDRTYGSVAGVIIGLVWLWLTNLALLLGAEIDAERERRKAVGSAQETAVGAGRPGGRTARPAEVATETPVYGPMPQPVPDED
jgi:membrane protein